MSEREIEVGGLEYPVIVVQKSARQVSLFIPYTVKLKLYLKNVATSSSKCNKASLTCYSTQTRSKELAASRHMLHAG